MLEIPLHHQPSIEWLVKHLAELYPDRCPSLDETEREIFYKSGQRSVVDFLIHTLSESENN